MVGRKPSYGHFLVGFWRAANNPLRGVGGEERVIRKKGFLCEKKRPLAEVPETAFYRLWNVIYVVVACGARERWSVGDEMRTSHSRVSEV